MKTPKNPRHLNEIWDKTISTFLASIEAPYVTICKYCFDAFKCETIAGKSVLSASPEIECGTHEHQIIRFLAFLGIIFYVILYTLIISYKLHAINYNDRFSDTTNLRRFGFLYKRFEVVYYYSSIIILLRKLVFVLILVFLVNPVFQAGAMTIVVIASLMLHVYSTPYVDVQLDWLFSVLLIDLMFMAFGGLMFSSYLLSEADRAILEWIVLFTIFILCIVFIFILASEIRKIYHLRYLMSKIQNTYDSDTEEIKKQSKSAFCQFFSSWGISDAIENVNFENRVC